MVSVCDKARVKKTLNPKSARGQGGLWVGGAFAFDVALAAQRATSVGHPKLTGTAVKAPSWSDLGSLANSHKGEPSRSIPGTS